MTDVNLKRENDILKLLLLDGFFWVNYYSQDCDGCVTTRAIKYKDLQTFYDEELTASMDAEGPMHFTLAPRYPDGTYDLSENYNGGQW
jgi:hypothetical protein